DGVHVMIPKTRPSLGLSELLSCLRAGTARQAFEEAVAARCGARYALSFTYAHAGFFAALQVLDLTGEIVIPAYTCSIMPEVIVATGNIPVFVDISLSDYNMDLDALKSAITGDTRAIVATHMFGNPANMDVVREMARDRHIAIVEDAALVFPEAMSSLGGLRGDVGLFSFGPGKPLFTIRGGAVVTNDAALYARIKSVREAQLDRLPSKEWIKRLALLMIHFVLSRGPVYSLVQRLNLSKDRVTGLASRLRPANEGEAGSGSLIPDDYDTRYADFQARIGLAQLAKSGAILAQRRAMARAYDQVLQDIPGLIPAPVVDGASFSLYAARVRNRDAVNFCQQMRAKGIEVGQTFNYALSEQKRYQSFVHEHCPRAEQLSREVVNLPMYAGLTEKQVYYIASSARQVFREGI
ncbi:MAG: DegT/DnrJ/EryC1/StrS family aminotransferase, partial [Anaerolineae bacterium]|nr:DegT/DnrJ/EryC1/StrS family aminotransferase [Anaerolineae bacterium]